MTLVQHEVAGQRSNKKRSARRALERGGEVAVNSESRVIGGSRSDYSPGLRNRTAQMQVPVTYWMPDGTCGEGVAPRVEGEVIFIESEQLVPSGTELTIRLTPRDDGSIGWNLAEGIVAWRCPSKDLFKNHKGFGVRLDRRSPSPHGPAVCEGWTEGGRKRRLRGLIREVVSWKGRLGRHWVRLDQTTLMEGSTMSGSLPQAVGSRPPKPGLYAAESIEQEGGVSHDE
jgi:hypothetical protein